MADEDKDSKTEDPSQKKLDEAREKGNLANSKELGNFFMLMVLAITIAWFLPPILRDTKNLLAPFLSDADSLAADQKGLSLILYKLAFGGFAIISLPLLASIISAIATSFLQHGFVLSAEPMLPKLNKISPIAGFGRIFSIRSLVDFAKNIIKVVLVGIVAFMAVYPELTHIRQLPNQSTENMLLFLWMLAKRIAIGVVIAMFFIALFDIIFQRFQHMKSLRMSKQELKDEYKQSEGDPMVKQRLRQLRMERARNRMMAAVPQADVVITNPTHFAVALKYDTNTMSAPTVVAKGQDLIALKIREIAEENDVPVIENPPLARALFASTDLDKEIPFTHYEAVAKIISYVYQLKGKKT
ncbi:MAG: flagellar biosynthesis protein FlhB [Pseudomonadota bacterium]|jgi:flagellar biosynthetic protein FlhB